MEFRRWTPFTYLHPQKFIDHNDFWLEFDLEEWSRSVYEWTEDPWNGFRDFAQRPAETVSSGKGDCEDYALVAASWALAHNHKGVGLAFCWESSYPWPTHAIAFDNERIYSSGSIYKSTVERWIADSKYSFTLKRRVA